MKRYYFTNTTDDGDDASAFIDAEDFEKAKFYYEAWCRHVFDYVPNNKRRCFLLPDLCSTPGYLSWGKHVVELVL